MTKRQKFIGEVVVSLFCLMLFVGGLTWVFGSSVKLIKDANDKDNAAENCQDAKPNFLTGECSNDAHTMDAKGLCRCAKKDTP